MPRLTGHRWQPGQESSAATVRCRRGRRDAQARGLEPNVPGDPAKRVQMAFVQGGYQHMTSYAHPWTHWAIFYSVVQIVNDI